MIILILILTKLHMWWFFPKVLSIENVIMIKKKHFYILLNLEKFDLVKKKHNKTFKYLYKTLKNFLAQLSLFSKNIK